MYGQVRGKVAVIALIALIVFSACTAVLAASGGDIPPVSPLPTADPSSSAVVDPTASPSESPSESPDVSPTLAPPPGVVVTPDPNATPAPTPSPTPKPTQKPTPKPTKKKAKATPTPTPVATIAPLDVETVEPSPSPTPTITPSPTQTPVAELTGYDPNALTELMADSPEIVSLGTGVILRTFDGDTLPSGTIISAEEVQGLNAAGLMSMAGLTGGEDYSVVAAYKLQWARGGDVPVYVYMPAAGEYGELFVLSVNNDGTAAQSVDYALDNGNVVVASASLGTFAIIGAPVAPPPSNTIWIALIIVAGCALIAMIVLFIVKSKKNRDVSPPPAGPSGLYRSAPPSHRR